MANERRFRALIDNCADAVTVCDQRGVVLVSDYAFAYGVDPDGTMILEWVTDAMTRLLGYTPEEMRTSAARCGVPRQGG